MSFIGLRPLQRPASAGRSDPVSYRQDRANVKSGPILRTARCRVVRFVTGRGVSWPKAKTPRRGGGSWFPRLGLRSSAAVRGAELACQSAVVAGNRSRPSRAAAITRLPQRQTTSPFAVTPGVKNSVCVNGLIDVSTVNVIRIWPLTTLIALTYLPVGSGRKAKSRRRSPATYRGPHGIPRRRS